MSAWKPTRLRPVRPSRAARTHPLQLCMPPQQISPSAASRSPCSSATSAASRNVSAIFLVLPSGSFSPVRRARRRVDAHDAVRPDPQFAQLLARSGRPCAPASRRPCAPPRSPSPNRRPSAATPARRAIRRRDSSLRILSASRLRSSSVESMLTCGSKRKRSTPSNVVAVHLAPPRSCRASCRDRSAAPSRAPLPTSPGHIALWMAGYLCWHHCTAER